ncbi:MAG: hypothetical protein ACMUIP_05500 [bacterium]
MVQRFPELQWIYHGLAVSVCSVLFIKALALDQERGDTSPIILDPDLAKVTTFTE